METIFTFDVSKIYPHVLEGIKNGKITLRDGVAYWTTLSGKSGIAQHLPLKQLQIENISEISMIIKSAQVAQLTAIGISTAVIIGVIIIQTVYLSKKIDKLQKTIDIISSDINAQNIIFYLDKMSKYFGAVESARIILLDRSLCSETQDIAAQLIPTLSNQRNEVLSLIDNLITFADKVTDRHLEHMLDFIVLMLDIMPKAIYVESQLCDRYGKFRYSEHLMRESSKRYNKTLSEFKLWCNSKAKATIRGDDNTISLPFHEKREELQALFQSKYNSELLNVLQSPNLLVSTE